MQKIYTEVLTFTNGTPVQVGVSAPKHGCRMLVEPARANNALAYVGESTMALGTSGEVHVYKQIAPPATATAALDNFDIKDENGDNNVVPLSYYFDGTTGQKVRVTIWTR